MLTYHAVFEAAPSHGELLPESFLGGQPHLPDDAIRPQF